MGGGRRGRGSQNFQPTNDFGFPPDPKRPGDSRPHKTSKNSEPTLKRAWKKNTAVKYLYYYLYGKRSTGQTSRHLGDVVWNLIITRFGGIFYIQFPKKKQKGLFVPPFKKAVFFCSKRPFAAKKATPLEIGVPWVPETISVTFKHYICLALAPKKTTDVSNPTVTLAHSPTHSHSSEVTHPCGTRISGFNWGKNSGSRRGAGGGWDMR